MENNMPTKLSLIKQLIINKIIIHKLIYKNKL
jgi:hypothetical protein